MSNIIKINKNPDHIKNIHRINRIHGQLKGVEKMIVEKRYCLEILQQTRAITSAIKSLENNILNKHIDHCVVDVSYTHLRAHETREAIVRRLLL